MTNITKKSLVALSILTALAGNMAIAATVPAGVELAAKHNNNTTDRKSVV